MAHITFIAIVALLPFAMAYPSGAPAGTCSHLTPRHRINGTQIPSQTAPSPYSIEVNSIKYEPAGTLTVTIEGDSFLGILLQARTSDGAVVGTFSDLPADTKFLECTNADDSVTHSSNANKSAGTSFTWNAPNMKVGAIKFTGTIVQDYDVFWVGLESDSIEAGANWISVNLGLLVTLVITSLAMSRE